MAAGPAESGGARLGGPGNVAGLCPELAGRFVEEMNAMIATLIILAALVLVTSWDASECS